MNSYGTPYTKYYVSLLKDSSFVAIKGVQKRRDFVAGRQVVNVCDHDIIRNYFFHWQNVGSGESRRDKGAVVPMSSWNNCDRAQAIFLVIILLFSVLISTTVKPPLTGYNSHYFWQTVHTLTPRVLSRIHCLAAEKSRVAKGNELPRGACGHAPPETFWNEYALRCNLVHFETQFCEMLQCLH